MLAGFAVDELCNIFLMIRDLSKMSPPARHPVSREEEEEEQEEQQEQQEQQQEQEPVRQRT